jgi:hypothetical protein
MNQAEATAGLATNLTTLVSQMVMGRHGVTNMQLFNALHALEQALPFLPVDVPITQEYVHSLRKKIEEGMQHGLSSHVNLRGGEAAWVSR